MKGGGRQSVLPEIGAAKGKEIMVRQGRNGGHPKGRSRNCRQEEGGRGTRRGREKTEGWQIT